MDEWGVAAWMDGREGRLLDGWAGEWMDVWMDGWVELDGRVGLRCRHRRLCHRLCHRHHRPVAIPLSTAALQFLAMSGSHGQRRVEGDHPAVAGISGESDESSSATS